MNAQQKIAKKLEEYGESNANVWKGYSPITLATGWHFTPFQGSPRFLGTSVVEAVETIQEWIWQREELA